MAKQSGQRRKWIIMGLVASLVLGMGGLAAAVAKSRYFGHHRGFLDPAIIESLNLAPEQQTIFEGLRRRSEAERGRGWKEMQSVKAVFEEEQAAEEPNLRRVVAEMEKRAKTVWADKEALIEEGLAFYDTLSAEQKRTVVDAIGQRMERFHGMRGRGHRGGEGSGDWQGSRAGPHHGRGPEAAMDFHLGRMGERLNLTDAQQASVAAIVESRKPRLETGAEELQANRVKLRDLIRQGGYDQATVQAVAEERGQLVAELTLLRAQMRSEIRAQLDADQREALEEMSEQRQPWRGSF